MHRRRILALAFALAAVSAVAGAARAQAAQAHTAFTLSNAAAGNRVIVFDRGSGGRLYRVGSVGTGGRGTGVNLGSEGALALSPTAATCTPSMRAATRCRYWGCPEIMSGASR